jgi:hypothetical protein
MLQDLQKLTALSNEAAKRLRESKEVAEAFETKLKDLKGDEYKTALDKTKAIKDSIASVFDYMLGKEDTRQGIVAQKDPAPVSFIGNAAFYISSSLDPVSETDRRVFNFAEQEVNKVLKRVDRFYESRWKEYRESMEKLVISPFKDYEPLKK